LEVGAVLAKVLPPGVLNVVSGGDSLGAQMTTHPTPRKISFTGSTAAGRQVALAAAADFKAVTLELGGNDPAIVLDDAEPQAIAKKLFWAAFTNNGQVCSAAKRVYVPEALHDELVDALAQQAGSVRVGDGTAERTQLGPINNRAQFDRVRGLVDDALSRGAVPAAGGHVIEGPGYFFEPTILAGATDGMPVVDEEQFGPVLPVIPYRDVDEAVARANAGEFGLTGSVWGSDRDRAAEVAARLDCGTVRVNDHSTLAPDQPFSGRKSSGLGVENGMPGLLSYTDVQVRYHSKR
jgi:acyl-CoA reductase-like NAD-dependent aldehyde dehydrogenase